MVLMSGLQQEKHWVGAGYRPGDLGATARPPLPSVAWSLLRCSQEQGGRDLLGDVQAQVADGSGWGGLSVHLHELPQRKKNLKSLRIGLCS